MSSWGNRHISKKPQIPKIHTIHSQKYSNISPLHINPHLYTSNIAFNDTYESTIIKINTFNKNNTDALITFIIPTINRYTLYSALESIYNQSVTNWKAIVIFDGCEPTCPKILQLLSNNRFLYFSINKKGIIKDKTHGAAGFVRNIAMSIVNTPWTGFLDDDDYILPNYTQSLIDEININPLAELISFRMIDKEQIIPPDFITSIKFGYIGISFCFRTQLFQEGFKFIQSEQEDFDFINSINNSRKKIIISPFITYIVRDSPIIYNKFRRIIIN
jgi:hypothetical protein